MISLLYVDDEQFLLDLAKNFFMSTAGFSVDTKSSAREGLRALASSRYDAIVADYQMPGMDGIGFLKTVRRDYGNIPFILLNDAGQEDVVIRALNAGADFYLRKQGDPRILFKGLEQVLNQCIKLRKPGNVLPDGEERYHDLQNDTDLIQSFWPDGRFLYVNKKWLETLGYQEEDLENLRISDIIHPESLEQCKALFQRILSGETVGIIDAAFRTRDGTRVYVEGIANSRMADGKQPCIRGIFRNVTGRRIAEAELQESEERFRSLAETTRDIVWEVDRDGCFIYVSPQVQDMLGYSPRELIGTVSFDLMTPGGAERFERAFSESTSASAAGKPFIRLEISVLHKDGKHLVLETSCAPIHTAAGSIRGYRCIGSDITERRKAEELLRESEYRYRMLVENANEAIFVIQDGRICFSNPKLEQISMFSFEELSQKPFLAFVHTDDRGSVRDQYNSRLAGESLKNSTAFRIVSREGSVLWMEINSSRITWNGQPAVLVLLSDITGHKHAVEALQESEQKYRDIFEKSVSGLFKTLPNGRLITANDALARMYGYSCAAEMLKADINILSNLYGRPEDRKAMVHLLAEKGRIENFEIEHIRRDGSRFWVSITARTIRKTDGTVIFYEGTIIDISERKLAEEAIRQANKKLTMLSSITRHDIRNNLMALRGFNQLSVNLVTDEKVMHYLRKQGDAVEAIGQQIEFTKDYENIGVKAPVWQNAYVITNNATALIDLKGITLKNDMENLEIYADSMLGKVFYNLIENSVRYGERISEIHVRYKKTSTGLIIVVEDNGIGITADEKEKIFLKGFGKNTGLGLFLSREILSITGITIRETGKKPGGARFEIAVPNGAFRFTSSR